MALYQHATRKPPWNAIYSYAPQHHHHPSEGLLKICCFFLPTSLLIKNHWLWSRLNPDLHFMSLYTYRNHMFIGSVTKSRSLSEQTWWNIDIISALCLSYSVSILHHRVIYTSEATKHCNDNLLHFERNSFTGVNRLTPQTELLHTYKNEVKVIPSLPAQSWKSSIWTRCFTPRWDWLLQTSCSGVKEITITADLPWVLMGSFKKDLNFCWQNSSLVHQKVT